MTDPTAWITQRRFDEYLVAANHDRVAACNLYEWNVAISAAFFELISHVEVAVRNAVDEVMKPPKVLERVDHIVWTPEEIGRRVSSGNEDDKRIAEIIKAARNLGWQEDEYQLFLLTRPDAKGQSQGHVTLDGELRHQRSGRGSAWVQRQRYVAVAALKSARTLGDLDQQ